jgi:hypothetical protein
MTITSLQPQPITNLGQPFTNPLKVDFNHIGHGTTYAGGFGSNQLNNQYGITPAFASSKVESAAASAIQRGGARSRKHKSVSSSGVSVKAFSKDIKNKMKIISNKYKNMKGKKSLSLKKMKSKFKSLFRTMTRNLKLKGGKKTRTARRTRSKGRVQKGGYHQYMGNVPATPGYSVAATTLGSQNLGLANPPPITRYMNGVDNYNHFLNKGFQLWN